MWSEKGGRWIAELLSALGEIRKDECKEREEALEKARRKEYSGATLVKYLPLPSSRAKSRDPLTCGTNKGKQRNIYFSHHHAL